MDTGNDDETAQRWHHFVDGGNRDGKPRGASAVAEKVSPASSGASPAPLGGLDSESQQWVRQLRVEHPRYDHTVERLHDVLRRVARSELSRRRHQLGSVTGPEFDDLAQQAADDAVVNVLSKLDDFRGLSRFTTWAYKFAMFEVSAKVARHAWRRQSPAIEELAWDKLVDPLAARPEDRLEQRSQLEALSAAIGELTHRQREVFVSVALNEIPIDVVALELGTNRNAVYKNLFDARRSLRERMADAGHPVGELTVRTSHASVTPRRPAGPAGSFQ
jgi:RNA polymerase sigma-70 factor (ECF subfamily)